MVINRRKSSKKGMRSQISKYSIKKVTSKKCKSVFAPIGPSKYVLYNKESSLKDYLKSGCIWKPFNYNVISKPLSPKACSTFCNRDKKIKKSNMSSFHILPTHHKHSGSNSGNSGNRTKRKSTLKHKKCYASHGNTKGKYILYDGESSLDEFLDSGCHWRPYRHNIIVKKINKLTCRTKCRQI